MIVLIFLHLKNFLQSHTCKLGDYSGQYSTTILLILQMNQTHTPCFNGFFDMVIIE